MRAVNFLSRDVHCDLEQYSIRYTPTNTGGLIMVVVAHCKPVLVSRCFFQQFFSSGRNTGFFFFCDGLRSGILCRFPLLPCGTQSLPYSAVLCPAPLSSLFCTSNRFCPFPTYSSLLLLTTSTHHFLRCLFFRGSQLMLPGTVAPFLPSSVSSFPAGCQGFFF